jgi:hypothetical protein
MFRIRIRIGSAFDGRLVRIRIPNADPDPESLKRAKVKLKVNADPKDWR